MPKYLLWRWKAINPHGQLETGATFAVEREALEEDLSNRQLQLLSVKKSARAGSACWHIQQKIDFIRQLAALLHAGIALTDALLLIARQHPKPEWSALLQHIEMQVSQGVALSETLKQWPRIFPPLFIALLHTGELTGRLAECCQRLAEQQEQQHQLTKKVVKALRYPLFILLVALLVTAGMIGFVLPEFANIYRTFNAPLPVITQVVMSASEWVATRGGWCVLAATVLSLIGWSIRRTRPNLQEKEQLLLLKIPVIAPLRRGQLLSQIFTVLTLSQHSGIPLLQGLEAVEKTLTQRLWQRQIAEVRTRVSEGQPLWSAMKNSGHFTPLCQQLVRIGEESGSLDSMLERLARWHYEKTQELAESLAATLEPLMMLVIGLIIGTLVIAMYLPIFQMGDAMSGG
ncbi:protein transport protein HofC [Cedecea sp.]|jgi:protein transport protein HofC|uniref:protein transport protein HofC n=1 Tax=Cedecea sp. TaxID=1970739 RepID=UPI0012AE3A32|nr:protein transport protein HofC [Enterobacteriaceae bacterium RIT693]